MARAVYRVRVEEGRIVEVPLAQCPHPFCDVIRMTCSDCGQHYSYCLSHEAFTRHHRCRCHGPRAESVDPNY